jgi:hypothetical protein
LRRWMRLPHLGGEVACAEQSRVVPVTLAPLAIPAANAGEPSVAIEIAVGGATVRVPQGACIAHLRLVLHALRG